LIDKGKKDSEAFSKGLGSYFKVQLLSFLTRNITVLNSFSYSKISLPTEIHKNRFKAKNVKK